MVAEAHVIARLVFCTTAVLTVATSVPAQTFQAKVVGISDGDTIKVYDIKVYDGQTQTRIRLEGIDCPESGADFSNRAKQLTSDLVFGKRVRIEGKERDQYGRLVARVFVGDIDLSLALVEAGLAWHYKQYSDDAVLAAAEVVARTKKLSMFSGARRPFTGLNAVLRTPTDERPVTLDSRRSSSTFI